MDSQIVSNNYSNDDTSQNLAIHNNSMSLKIHLRPDSLVQLQPPCQDASIRSLEESVNLSQVKQSEDNSRIDCFKNSFSSHSQIQPISDLDQILDPPPLDSKNINLDQPRQLQQKCLPQLRNPLSLKQPIFHNEISLGLKSQDKVTISYSPPPPKFGMGGEAGGNDCQNGGNNLLKQIKLRKVIQNFLKNLPSRKLKFINEKQYPFFNSDKLLFTASGTNNDALHQIPSLKIRGEQYEGGKSQVLSLYKQIQFQLLKIIKSIPVIDPMSKFSFFVDIVMLINCLFYFIYIPLHLTFEITIHNLLNGSYCIIMPIIYIIVNIIKIFTSFHDKGNIIRKTELILHRYFKKQLKVDLLPLLSVIALSFSASYKNQMSQEMYKSIDLVWCLLFFFKIFSFRKCLREIKDKFSLKRSILRKITLLKLLFTILIIAHYLACLWCFTAIYEKRADPTTITWLDKALIGELSTNNWSEQYLNAYYFSAVTMITVGYGDITPVTPLEKLISILTMLLSCGVFGYTMNSIGVVVQEFNKINQLMQEKLLSINKYMNQKNINKDLQYQIRDYLSYYGKEDADFFNIKEQQEKIISQLSEPLRKALLKESNKNILNNSYSPIFQAKFSQTLTQALIPFIKEVKCSPGEVIISSDQDNDCSLYFIEKGNSEIFMDIFEKDNMMQELSALHKHTLPLYVYSEGMAFNQYSFFTGMRSKLNIRCRNYCLLQVIRRKDFLDLLETHSEDFERFCYIKDNLLQNGSYSLIASHCPLCHQTSHDIAECPFVHYVPCRPKIIRQFEKQPINSLRNLSKTKIKRRQCKHHTLNNILFLSEIQTEFVQDNEEFFNNSIWKNYLDYDQLIHQQDSSQCISMNANQHDSTSSQDSHSNKKRKTYVKKYEGEIIQEIEDSQSHNQNKVNNKNINYSSCRQKSIEQNQLLQQQKLHQFVVKTLQQQIQQQYQDYGDPCAGAGNSNGTWEDEQSPTKKKMLLNKKRGSIGDQQLNSEQLLVKNIQNSLDAPNSQLDIASIQGSQRHIQVSDNYHKQKSLVATLMNLQETILKQECPLANFFTQFEKFKIFKYYYPQFNINRVLDLYKRFLEYQHSQIKQQQQKLQLQTLNKPKRLINQRNSSKCNN